ncbi:TetR/AcrR family transcriptional regulator [Plantactinospora sp. GCM10030261]|uniref:TetR/AcrR family transcriptional regulator n=1 Tax=Plantactinospora sp. GCM10030261 TaxID=3273420 RepID=UPI003615703A
MSAGPRTPRRDGPGRPRDPDADTAILRAAIDLLIERGIDQTSIEQIAKRAGVAKVTVYRRWRTKEELLAHALESVRADLPTVVDDHERDSSLSESIEQLLPVWGRALADPRLRALTARMTAAGHDHPHLLDVYWRRYLRPRRQRAAAVMRQAQHDGLLDPAADVDVLIDMMEGAIMYRLLVQPDTLQPATISRYLHRLLTQVGFRLPPHTAADETPA